MQQCITTGVIASGIRLGFLHALLCHIHTHPLLTFFSALISSAWRRSVNQYNFKSHLNSSDQSYFSLYIDSRCYPLASTTHVYTYRMKLLTHPCASTYFYCFLYRIILGTILLASKFYNDVYYAN